MHLGAHVGTAGGSHRAIRRAREIGARSIQIFTQSPRMWRHPPLDPEAAERFREARSAARLPSVVCHATYLINLGAIDDATYARSVKALADTMRTAAAIGADAVVVHLGSHLGRGLDAALEQVVPAVQIVLGQTPEPRPWLLFENAAGTGATMGATPAELQAAIDAVEPAERVGVCLDTCHLWAAGVDIADPARVDALLDELDERVGLDRLRCLHVNDSELPLGARRDRHANVGDGTIGRGLSVMLGHPRLQRLPAIMETPGPDGHGADRTDMAALRRLHRNGLRRWARRPARHA